MSVIMERKGMIRPINFSIFYQISNAGLAPDEVALFESTENENIGFGQNRLEVIVLGVCLSGSVKFKLGRRNYTAHAGCAVLIMPGQVLQAETRSPDYNAFFVALTPKVAQSDQAFSMMKRQLFARVRTNAVLQLPDPEWRALIDSFIHIREKYHTCKNNNLHKKMFELQAFSVLYEFCGYLTTAKQHSENLLSKKELLFRNFIRLVAEHHHRERNISFYADKLGINLKYLSATVEAATQKSPKQWLDNYVIQDARHLLKNSDKCIQQIAEELNFADQAAFSRYFRRLEGISPRKYRSYTQGGGSGNPENGTSAGLLRLSQ